MLNGTAPLFGSLAERAHIGPRGGVGGDVAGRSRGSTGAREDPVMHRPHPERGMRVLALRIASSPHHASSGFRRRSRVVVGVVFAGVTVAAPGRHGGRARQFHGDPLTGRRRRDALDRE